MYPASSASQLYRNLATQGREIRLLSIKAFSLDVETLEENFRQEVVSELKVVDLESYQGKYIALSYTWGNEKADCEIVCGGLKLLVTRSCSDALRVLRSMNVVDVWIDQLCVDQHSMQERSVQVALMDRIYSKAVCVYVWLGWPSLPGRPSSFSRRGKVPIAAESPYDALDRVASRLEAKVRRMGALKDLEDSMMERLHVALQNAASAHEYTKLTEWRDECCVVLDMLRRRYFTRRWIVQEIALNSKTNILFGNRCWEFDMMEGAFVELFRFRSALIRGPHDTERELLKHLLGFDLNDDDLSDDYGKFEGISTVRFQSLDPIELFSSFANCDVKLPHDNVYALRALLKDPESLPVPDYSLETGNLYLQHSVWLVKTLGEPDCSLRQIFISTMTRRSSLIEAGFVSEYRESSRFLAKSLWSLSRWCKYHELGHVKFIDKTTGADIGSQSILPGFSEERDFSISLQTTSQSAHCLTVLGFVLDTVTDIVADAWYFDVCPEGTYSASEVWNFYQDMSSKRTDEVDSFCKREPWWTSIVQTSGAIGSFVYDHSTYHRERVLAQLCTGKHEEKASKLEGLNRAVRESFGEIDSEELAEAVKTRAESGDDWTFNALNFACTKDGWPVLVPRTTQIGDEIAFFHGVRTPFVLRSCGGGQSRLRGRAHVYSLNWWWDWTYQLQALKNTKAFLII